MIADLENAKKNAYCRTRVHFPMGNSSWQLHANFGYITLSVVKCKFYS